MAIENIRGQNEFIDRDFCSPLFSSKASNCALLWYADTKNSTLEKVKRKSADEGSRDEFEQVLSVPD